MYGGDAMPKLFSTNKLKYIAIIAMTIDHIAWLFVPSSSIAFYVLHIIGRLTAPIMAYFIAEGFFHTSNNLSGLLFFVIILPDQQYVKFFT